MKALSAFGILAAFGLILLSGCAVQSVQDGFLQGKVTIGPLCPVEHNPPDPNCQPTEQTYIAYPLSAYNAAGLKVLEFHADANGDYKVGLAPGNYSIMQETGISRFSQEATINPGETTVLDIGIDTGIR